MMPYISPIRSLDYSSSVSNARLPFKVLMFGSTEYDAKHRLLDRFIKEAGSQPCVLRV